MTCPERGPGQSRPHQVGQRPICPMLGGSEEGPQAANRRPCSCEATAAQRWQSDALVLLHAPSACSSSPGLFARAQLCQAHPTLEPQLALFWIAGPSACRIASAFRAATPRSPPASASPAQARLVGTPNAPPNIFGKWIKPEPEKGKPDRPESL